MPRAEHGFKRAVSEIIGGMVTGVVLNAFISSGLLQPSQVFMFKIINLLGTITMILAMPYWGTTYLLGWLYGLYVMAKAGLVGIGDFIIYFGIPLCILFYRIAKSAEDRHYYRYF